MSTAKASVCIFWLTRGHWVHRSGWRTTLYITARRVRSQAASFMLTCAHSTRPHPGRPRLPRKVLLQPGRHGLQSMGHYGRQGWRCHLLGPMVPRSGSFFFARVSASLSARTMICCSNLIYADCEAAPDLRMHAFAMTSSNKRRAQWRSWGQRSSFTRQPLGRNLKILACPATLTGGG